MYDTPAAFIRVDCTSRTVSKGQDTHIVYPWTCP